jgi:hypothetical protein
MPENAINLVSKIWKKRSDQIFQSSKPGTEGSDAMSPEAKTEYDNPAEKSYAADDQK